MRTRPLAKVAVLGVVGAMALAGCGSSNDNKSGGGLKAGGSGGNSTSYTIAFEGPLSGDNQQLGINEEYGVQLAVAQANADSSLGFKIKLITSDDQGDPAKAPAAAATITQDDTVMGVVGPSFSGATKAVAAKFGAKGITIVNPSASAGDIQTLHFPTWHRIFPNDNAEGPAGADWIAKHAKKVYVINDLSAYGAGVSTSVSKQLKKDKVTVVTQGVDAKTTDYGPVSQQVVNSGAQAVWYGGYDAQAALFAKALDAAGYKGIRISGNGVKSSVFTSGAGKAGEGWYFTCGCQDATVAPSAKDFAAAYQAKFNTPPSTYSPEAFDATNILIQAIKAAKAAGAVTRSAVNDAVNQTDYTGITGQISFGTDGDLPPGKGTVNLFQDKGGNITSLGDITQAK